MEYISAEEFLKQPREIQQVFLDWWKPSISDLYTRKHTKGMPYLVWKYEDECILSTSTISNVWDEKTDCIPLLTEGQLRHFIEDMTDSTMALKYDRTQGYNIILHPKENGLGDNIWFPIPIHNLFQAYWKVACEIAKEG